MGRFSPYHVYIGLLSNADTVVWLCRKKGGESRSYGVAGLRPRCMALGFWVAVWIHFPFHRDLIFRRLSCTWLVIYYCTKEV